MKIARTFNVQIWCGLREGYEGPVHTVEEVIEICQEYVNNVKYCVTVSPTTFVYVNGREPGAVIGMINYPRFETTVEEILRKATALADILMKRFGQHRVTVTTPTETIMLENEVSSI